MPPTLETDPYALLATLSAMSSQLALAPQHEKRYQVLTKIEYTLDSSLADSDSDVADDSIYYLRIAEMHKEEQEALTAACALEVRVAEVVELAEAERAGRVAEHGFAPVPSPLFLAVEAELDLRTMCSALCGSARKAAARSRQWGSPLNVHWSATARCFFSRKAAPLEYPGIVVSYCSDSDEWVDVSTSGDEAVESDDELDAGAEAIEEMAALMRALAAAAKTPSARPAMAGANYGRCYFDRFRAPAEAADLEAMRKTCKAFAAAAAAPSSRPLMAGANYGRSYFHRVSAPTELAEVEEMRKTCKAFAAAAANPSSRPKMDGANYGRSYFHRASAPVEYPGVVQSYLSDGDDAEILEADERVAAMEEGLRSKFRSPTMYPGGKGAPTVRVDMTAGRKGKAVHDSPGSTATEFFDVPI